MKHRVATDEIREIAAAFSLGALESHEARAFEDHLAGGCHICRTEIEGFSATAAALALGAAEQEPPRHTRPMLLSRLNGYQKHNESDSPIASPNQFLSIRDDEGEWIRMSEGVLIKRLYVDPSSGLATSLVRMEAGTALPGHRHRGVEQFLVIEGDCRVHGENLGPGDYHRAETGSVHETTYTVNGTMLLLVAPEGYDVLDAR
ncbi:MAG TPA: cupin domain-containing protein [Blastocatellia bacterium]|nr:cupin domain-containing protein [Blastocatellia bacterium]